jgi:ABC-type uncharacterized transport system substrate-binding protein
VTAILFSAGTPSQAAVAERIAAGLDGPEFTLRLVDIDRIGTPGVDVGDAPTDVEIVAAVGPGALDVARRIHPGARIVFSQVLAPTRRGDARGIRGVAAMPPPALQFAAWAEVDPGLERIGLITGAAFAAAVPDAEQAAAGIGAELVHRVSTSDLETLYLFRRLAPAIDGLWLAPDSEILSPVVIDAVLKLAAELKIGVLVFSESLLDRGGLISVGAPAEHVAETVVDAIRRIRSGRADTLPAEIPLQKAAVRVNARVAAALGLLVVTPTEWVTSESP